MAGEQQDVLTADTIIELLAEQGKVKYDRSPTTWGMDNLVLLAQGAFEPILKEGRSRADIQNALYEEIKVPCYKVFGSKEPSGEGGKTRIPEYFIEKCKEDPNALIPLLFKPESIKIVVAGGPGTPFFAYVSTWGFGSSHFVTKSIKLPKNWDNILDKYKGWETPIIK